MHKISTKFSFKNSGHSISPSRYFHSIGYLIEVVDFSMGLDNLYMIVYTLNMKRLGFIKKLILKKKKVENFANQEFNRLLARKLSIPIKFYQL